MQLVERLKKIWLNTNYPFLISKNRKLKFSDITNQNSIDLNIIQQGDVVALIGDFNPETILILLKLIDMRVVIVPLTTETENQHKYFFESAYVNVIIKNNKVIRLKHNKKHNLIEKIKKLNNSGLILFSSGTTGKPKAILHDLTRFLKRFETPRPALRTINFLLFDHIGGLNSLFHTLFNKGTVVAPGERSVENILQTCRQFNVELLPTTPTFLRMMLIGGSIKRKVPKSLKIITYGTEKMDQVTLNSLCKLLPNIDFRQTFGMSELGIVRVKSESRSSLFMKVGGEGVETRTVDGVLHIRSKSRMLGYLNAPSPFDSSGWYDTKDIVDEKDGYYKVVGRISDVINVGGLKFMASEVECVALGFPSVSFVKAYPRENPITGQHVELIVQTKDVALFDRDGLKIHLKNELQSHMVPKRIRLEEVEIGHRFKKS